MSFGFSVGDFIAVGGVIVDLVNTLRRNGSEYQELVRELENLKKALVQVDRLKGYGDQASAIDQIKCAALTCRYPLEDFLVKVQRYEKSLGLGKSDGKIKDARRKIRYAFGKKDEASTLRNYLNIHIGTINMLMLRQGLEMLDIASEETNKNQQELIDKIESSSRELREVRGNVKAQALAVRENNSVLHKLFKMVSGEIATPLRCLSQTVAQVCVSTQQIYTIMLELKASVAGIDTRFTYFQTPVRVEDALGRVFPFASECSIDALDAEIRARFRDSPGKAQVLAGHFEIFDAKSTDQVLSVSDRSVLIPGMSIHMAIVVRSVFIDGDKCPMPHCLSRTLMEAIDGGKTCTQCHVSIDKSSKKRKRDIKGVKSSKRCKSSRNQYNEGTRRNFDNEVFMFELFDSLEEISIATFKRIRFDRWATNRRTRARTVVPENQQDTQRDATQQVDGKAKTEVSNISTVDLFSSPSYEASSTEPEQYIACDKLWNRVSSSQKLISGELNMDDLCAELKFKARCSGKCAVVSQADVDAILD